MKKYSLVLLCTLLSSSCAFACDVKGIENIEGWNHQSSTLINLLVSSNQSSCHEKLLGLLKHKNPSLRVMVAEQVGNLRPLPSKAIPMLIANFSEPDGEAGIVYYEAVAKYGNQAEELVLKALKSESWLIRARACDSLMLIRKTKNMAQKHICNE